MAWQIDRHLWVMGRPTKLDQITRLGVSALVSVNHRVPPPEVLNQWTQIGAWVHHPLPDGKRVDQVALDETVKRVQWFMNRGYRVAVHCDAGRNRACLVAARVVMEQHGYTGAQAAAYVRNRRPRALANAAQAAWLESLP